MSASSVVSHRSRARWALWLGIFCLFGGIAAYVVQLLVLHRTTTPWYLLATATIGFLLVLFAAICRPTILRVLTLLVVAAIGAAQWHLILHEAKQPAYVGPVKTGLPLPEFQAKRADGSAFTRTDLQGDQATALVFFRGHW